ncbi:MAG: hypothetical protein IH977_01330 [Nitrospinae bacterium]|nr:hypothetical protein [Nitrospinota bacterium]
MSKKKGDWPGPRGSGKFDHIALRPAEDFYQAFSKHTTFTSQQLKKLFPTAAEQKAFIDLMKILDSKTSENQKKAELIRDFVKYSGIILKLLRRAVKGN